VKLTFDPNALEYVPTNGPNFFDNQYLQSIYFDQ
jgi:hypothetical protein